MAFRSVALLVLGLGALPAFAQSSFYGGDPDLADALGAEVNTLFAESLTYDDFTLGTAGKVTEMFGNFGVATTIDGLYYEIRSGVSEGNGGTLLYSGTLVPTAVATGDLLIGFDVFRVSGAPTDVVLQPGTYWMALAVVDSGAGRAWVATTDGQNGVGGPLSNGNSFYSSSLGDFFVPAALAVGLPGRYDFSMGITTQPVPEPASFAVLGLGALGLRRRRKRV